MTATARLEALTPDNVLAACALEVAPEQRRFVAPVAQSLPRPMCTPASPGPG